MPNVFADDDQKPLISGMSSEGLTSDLEREDKIEALPSSPYKSYLQAKLTQKKHLIKESEFHKKFMRIKETKEPLDFSEDKSSGLSLDFDHTKDDFRKYVVKIAKDNSQKSQSLSSGNLPSLEYKLSPSSPDTPSENVEARIYKEQKEKAEFILDMLESYDLTKQEEEKENKREADVKANAGRKSKRKPTQIFLAESLLFSVSFINYLALLAVLAESAYHLIEQCGVSHWPFMEQSPFLSNGMSILLVTLAFEGFGSAIMAGIDKTTEDRKVAILEGVSKGIASTMILVLRAGLIPVSAMMVGYLVPSLFLVIVAGMIIKEESLLNVTRNEIAKITKHIENDTKILDELVKELKFSNGDPEQREDGRQRAIEQIARRLAASQQQLEILQEKEKNIQKAKKWLYLAVVSVFFVMLAAAFPPLGLTSLAAVIVSIALTTLAFALFTAVVTRLRQIKADESKAITKIKEASSDAWTKTMCTSWGLQRGFFVTKNPPPKPAGNDDEPGLESKEIGKGERSFSSSSDLFPPRRY